MYSYLALFHVALFFRNPYEVDWGKDESIHRTELGREAGVNQPSVATPPGLGDELIHALSKLPLPNYERHLP